MIELNNIEDQTRAYAAARAGLAQAVKALEDELRAIREQRIINGQEHLPRR